jgi:hypothetical protein
MTPAQAFLNRIEIASPCPADWAEMEGDDRARFCAQCERHVYDLSMISAQEAVALIQVHEGALCIRLWRRADGTVMTADCPVGAKRARSRQRRIFPVSAACLLAFGLTACGPRRPPECRPAVTGDTLTGAVVVVGGAVGVSTDPGMTVFRREDLDRLPLR